jgi:hypothetical protein
VERNLSKIFVVFLFLFESLLFAASPESTFETNDDQISSEGKLIIGRTADKFREILGVQVGAYPIHVYFVENLHLGDLVRTGEGEIQGVTMYGEKKGIIEILKHRQSSLARVLSHEVTHVFIREAFGPSSNQFLNEGLAVYFAGQICPVEIRQQMDLFSYKPAPTEMRPYIEGYRFVRAHIKDPKFSEFLKDELKHSCDTLHDLELRWKEWKSLRDA